MLSDVKEKMTIIKEWVNKTSEKFTVKHKSDNEKIRNFIIMPRGAIVVADVSQKEILKRLMFSEDRIDYALMNYPSGYYQSGKIILFQGDLSRPETIKPVTSDNIPLIKTKIDELKRMLKCGDKVSVHFHKKIDNTSAYFQAQFVKVRGAINSLLHTRAKSELVK